MTHPAIKDTDIDWNKVYDRDRSTDEAVERDADDRPTKRRDAYDEHCRLMSAAWRYI